MTPTDSVGIRPAGVRAGFRTAIALKGTAAYAALAVTAASGGAPF